MSGVNNQQNTQPNFKTQSVTVIASGPWVGTINDASGTKNIMGTGNKTFQLSSYPGKIVVEFQKDGTKDSRDSNDSIIPNTSPLTVQLLSGDTIIANKTTTEDGGIVNISNNIL
ncbi:hypothetical protein Metbo_1993 [Methanobacterium lacus]|uniref:Uncharacterized protein n=1 Tax=Methanobacterium lacus (strain AL-21) TaxID=877455 RepID=F0TBE4_METLA|nr:hypothetical protein [Methanobacterium lacus]ADZ10213.1 hypothetical protein Metbo_1993 [Methanobacterium lacus]